VSFELVDLADLAAGDQLHIGKRGHRLSLAKPGAGPRPVDGCALPWHDRTVPLPPELPRSPLWQTLAWSFRPLAFMARGRAEIGDAFSVSFVGFERPMVLISDPAAGCRRDGASSSNRCSARARSCCSRARSTSPAAG